MTLGDEQHALFHCSGVDHDFYQELHFRPVEPEDVRKSQKLGQQFLSLKLSKITTLSLPLKGGNLKETGGMV